MNLYKALFEAPSLHIYQALMYGLSHIGTKKGQPEIKSGWPNVMKDCSHSPFRLFHVRRDYAAFCDKHWVLPRTLF